MAPGSFGALWCSWKRRPLSSGVIVPQVVIAPTGVAQTGNANNIAPASAEGILEAPAYRLNPDEARDHVNRIRRFRILIMGRANSGKTSVLQRICNTTDQPIFDGEGRKVDPSVIQGSLRHGHHDIENELVFKSNPHFVFHDSCGFEASSISAFNQMKEFVMDHARTPKLEIEVFLMN